MAYNSPMLYSSTTEDDAVAQAGTVDLTMPGLGALDSFVDGLRTRQEQTFIAANNILPDAIADDQDYPVFRRTEGEWAAFSQEAGKMVFDGAAYAASLWGGVVASPATLGTSVVAAPLAMKSLLSYRDFGVAKQEAVDRGVDEHTANELGALQAAQTFLLFDMKLPLANQISKLASPAMRVASRVGVGAATQIGLDAAGMESRAQILEDNGYGEGENAEWVKQMRQWDWKRVAADALMGQMLNLHENFGEIRSRNVKGDGAPITDDDLTGASATFSADEARHGSAPGIPVDEKSSRAHVDATMKAMDDIANDRPVDVGDVDGLDEATFLRDAPPANEKEAEDLLTQRQKIRDEDERNLRAAEANLEAAQRDGMNDLVDYLSDELTRWQANATHSQNLVNEAQAHLDHIRDPENTELAEAVRRMQENAKEWQAEADTEQQAHDFSQPFTEPPPSGNATMDEAEAMYEGYRQAAEGESPWPDDMTAQREPTETQKRIDELTQELRKRHEGDPEIAEYLDRVSADHRTESDEFRTYEILAQCAIENM